MLDDSTELLVSSGKETWYIRERDNWDLKSVTEADEASSLDRSIDVQAACKDLRLVGHNTANTTLDLREASDHVLCVAWHDLIKGIPVAHVLDHGEHVIGLVWVVRHNVVEQLS